VRGPGVVSEGPKQLRQALGPVDVVIDHKHAAAPPALSRRCQASVSSASLARYRQTDDELVPSEARTAFDSAVMQLETDVPA
jgi:hypothetical protein